MADQGPRIHAFDTGGAVRIGGTAAGAADQPLMPLFDAPRLSRRAQLVRRIADGPASLVARPLLDVLALVVAVVGTMRWPGEPVALADGLPLVLLPLVVVAILALRGAYVRRLSTSALDDVARATAGVSLGVMILLVPQVYLSDGAVELGVLVHLWGLGVLALCAAHLGVLALQRHARLHGGAGRRTLVVGAGHVGERIARRLLESPQYGLVPVGFLDAQPPTGVERSVPLLGGPSDLDWIAQLADVEHVVLAFSASADSVFVPIVRRCEDLGLGVSVVPRLFDALNDRTSYETVGGLPLLGLHLTDPRGLPFTVKHALDRVIAGTLLVLLSPLMLSLALAVRLSSPGPILFRQRRVGRDGKPFDCLKFRSMAPAPEDAEHFVPAEGAAPGGVEGVDRRTLVGRFMRRTSLDELPQLINVVRGEMSLVGPRPERPEYVERFRRDIERYGERHRVRAGVTGWAQVNGLRGQTSIADRAEWDNYYIEHWSLWLDLKILLLTIGAIFKSAE
jgi:exopolysaccharide biosynthesis polyprenyl glycosylphosphotransferase